MNTKKNILNLSFQSIKNLKPFKTRWTRATFNRIWSFPHTNDKPLFKVSASSPNLIAFTSTVPQNTGSPLDYHCKTSKSTYPKQNSSLASFPSPS